MSAVHTPRFGALAFVLLGVWLVATIVVFLPADTGVTGGIRAGAAAVSLGLAAWWVVGENRRAANPRVQLGFSLLTLALVVSIVLFAGGLVGSPVLGVGGGVGIVLSLLALVWYGVHLQRRQRTRGDI